MSNNKEYDKARWKLPETKRKDRTSKIKNKRQRLLYKARDRARDRNLPFDITINDVIIPDRCPVLDIPIICDAKHERVDGSPTIDRIDNTKGYVKGNICVISNRANTIKSYGSIDEHQKVIDFMKLYIDKSKI